MQRDAETEFLLNPNNDDDGDDSFVNASPFVNPPMQGDRYPSNERATSKDNFDSVVLHAEDAPPSPLRSYEPPSPQPAPAVNAEQPALPRPTQPPARQTRREGGFLGFLSKLADDLADDISSGIEKLGEMIEKEVADHNVAGEKAFQRDFALPDTERLLGTYGCKVLNGPVGQSGTAYISTNFFCFQGGGLRIVIPLQSIVRIQKAVMVRRQTRHSHEPPTPPVFQPVEAHAPGDCLQMFTNDNLVHHFYSSPLSLGAFHNVVITFESWYKLVDEAWRASQVRSQSTPPQSVAGSAAQASPASTWASVPPLQSAPQQPPQQGAPSAADLVSALEALSPSTNGDENEADEKNGEKADKRRREEEEDDEEDFVNVI